MPTTDEIRANWDAYAASFALAVEPTTMVLGRSLVHALRLAEATAAIEVGCGAGGLAAVVRGALPSTATFVATDLSPAMIGLAREKHPGIDFREADAEALPFEDGRFDRLIANLNLMIVADTGRALADARRVLRPGGLAGFTVWGRPEQSPMMTIPNRAAENVGVSLPQPDRSNFHLGDRDATMARLREAGFTDVLAWYAPMISPVRDAADFARQMAETWPRTKMSMQGLPQPQKDALVREMERLAAETLASGRPIALDVLVLVAKRA